MKIKFYQLPKAERIRILDMVEKFTKERNEAQEQFYRAKNRMEEAQFHLDKNNRFLQQIRDKYDFE